MEGFLCFPSWHPVITRSALKCTAFCVGTYTLEKVPSDTILKFRVIRSDYCILGLRVNLSKCHYQQNITNVVENVTFYLFINF